MILPKIRDKRFITIRRGGELTDDDHHLLAIWAAECDWQRSRLPEPIRELVLDDQRIRDDICWFVFGGGR
jgi:hypothetical protein